MLGNTLGRCASTRKDDRSCAGRYQSSFVRDFSEGKKPYFKAAITATNSICVMVGSAYELGFELYNNACNRAARRVQHDPTRTIGHSHLPVDGFFPTLAQGCRCLVGRKTFNTYKGAITVSRWSRARII